MKRNRLKILGLTGEIAAGKSAVSSVLREKNGYIIDADEMSHAVILKDCPAYGEILAAIPGDYLSENGEINRKKLGEIVFAHSAYLRSLEAAVHKHVINGINSKIAEQSFGTAYRFIVIDAPLLKESGMDKLCDCVWVVEAPEETRVRRIMERNRLTREQAEARINARRPPDTQGCIIIGNSGGFSELKSSVLKNLTDFLEN